MKIDGILMFLLIQTPSIEYFSLNKIITIHVFIHFYNMKHFALSKYTYIEKMGLLKVKAMALYR